MAASLAAPEPDHATAGGPDWHVARNAQGTFRAIDATDAQGVRQGPCTLGQRHLHEELRPAAGAACAARLISDIEAISLADHEESAAIPSYRSLSLIAPEKMIAALGRRVFEAGRVPESVDYAHRTTAEYLGAAWLADLVRSGMPFGRLRALIGIDGHPAPELRGLHAWLAVHLAEHADRLIDSDPYGVLTYGDAASLSQSSCVHLVKALGSLSQTDPWFRSGHWQSPAIAALSRADMAEEFRAVLRSPDAGFGVRSIVVEAAARAYARAER